MRSHLNTQLISETRNAYSLTQEQVARRIGVTRSQLANIEGGKTDPSLEVLMNLAVVLALPIDDLCDWTTTTVREQGLTNPLPFDQLST